MRTISLKVSAPLVLARRIALTVERRMPAPLWMSFAGLLGAVLVVASMFLPLIEKWLMMSLGLFMIAALVFTMVGCLSNEKALRHSTQAAHGLQLMEHGINNPQRHLKQRPDLVEAHVVVARELGVRLRHTSEYDADDRLFYDASLLVLSGRVAPKDSHLLVAAVKRGFLDADDILAEVAMMKSHGYALAEGAL
jgi:hypothetical protein